MTINWKKPTAQMLGRFQPFHDGHKTLFKEILKKTGQVVIMIEILVERTIQILLILILSKKISRIV